jgi:hypothetical protein
MSIEVPYQGIPATLFISFQLVRLGIAKVFNASHQRYPTKITCKKRPFLRGVSFFGSSAYEVGTGGPGQKLGARDAGP